MEALAKIQQELKAPKNQHNKFGGYNYRSCEDILEAVKPLLKKHGCVLKLSDKTIEVAGIPVVNATVVIWKGEDCATVSAQAGVDINRKGMDISQSFGASSSYARKYALNGLFLIDDTKDADATNKHGKEIAGEAFKPKKFKDYKAAMGSAKNAEMVKDIAKAYNQEVQDKHWSDKDIDEAGKIYHARINDFTMGDVE
jgi:hypothetical protein